MTRFKWLSVSLIFCVVIFSSCSSNNGRQSLLFKDQNLKMNISGVWEGVVRKRQQGADYLKLSISGHPQKSNIDHYEIYDGNIIIQSFEDFAQKRTNFRALNIQVRLNRNNMSFSIEPVDIKKSDTADVKLVKSLGGVIDTSEKALVGLTYHSNVASPSNPSGDFFFFFNRPENFKKTHRYLNKFPEYRTARLLGKIPSQAIFLAGVNHDKVISWFRQSYSIDESPDFFRMSIEDASLIAQKIFRDKSFTPFFGDSYDNLSLTKLASISRFPRRDLKLEESRALNVVLSLFTSKARLNYFNFEGMRYFNNWYQNTVSHFATSKAKESARIEDFSILENHFKILEKYYYSRDEKSISRSLLLKTK